MTTIAYVYACDTCSLEFDAERIPRARPRTRCPDCSYSTHLARNRAWRQRRQDVVVLSDEHPVQPLLAAWVNHDCAVRLALAALRTGRYAEAEAAMVACLPDEVPRQSVA